eukprot:TRINITY_DN2026_c0_g1_i1.p1 TRINITY_DN2026_c0_g1~~TRINITY_DN2026_c0_g1_i1.p1  ORF type:complete len:760 (+),score=307.47 TRINITY_DN2026_c0_g1_i1:53-2332(+)
MYGSFYKEKMIKRSKMWENEEKLSLEERRQRYRCRNRFVTLDNLETWDTYILKVQARNVEEEKRWLAYVEAKKLAEEERKKAREEREKRREERKQKRAAVAALKKENKLKQQEQAPPSASPEEAPTQEETKPEETKSEVVKSEDVKSEETKSEDVKSEDVKSEETKSEDVKSEETKNPEDVKSEETIQEEDEDDDEDEDDSDSDSDEPIWSPRFKHANIHEPPPPFAVKYKADPELNKKMIIWRGDITSLEIDAVVNAANRSLLGGGGIDGAIHSAAGHDLYMECKQLNGCETGGCKISRAYNLPAKYVLHTVGPVGEKPKALRAAYLNCLTVAVRHNVKVLAFCGISTGIYGYPLMNASIVALDTVRRWLDKDDNRNKIDKIIFCTFLEKELQCYEYLTQGYFPVEGTPVTDPQPTEEYEGLYYQPESEPEVESEEEEEEEEDDEDEDEDDEVSVQQLLASKDAAGLAAVTGATKSAENQVAAENQEARDAILALVGSSGQDAAAKSIALSTSSLSTTTTNDGDGDDGDDDDVLDDVLDDGVIGKVDEATQSSLEKKLIDRPDKKDLVDKNIMKEGNVHGALQAPQAALKKEKLAQKLDEKLDNRPQVQELIDRNVLKSNPVAPALQAATIAVAKEKLVQSLEKQVGNRPDKEVLIERNVIKDDNVAPSLQAAKVQLEKEQKANLIATNLQNRPTKDQLVERNVLKGGNVAPALQSTQASLAKKQKTDQLEKLVAERPERETLEKDGILEKTPDTSQS